MLDAKSIGPGEEQYEYFTVYTHPKKRRCQYDYRAADGELFSCVAPTLGDARQRRDQWLQSRSDA